MLHGIQNVVIGDRVKRYHRRRSVDHHGDALRNGIAIRAGDGHRNHIGAIRQILQIDRRQVDVPFAVSADGAGVGFAIDGEGNRLACGHVACSTGENLRDARFRRIEDVIAREGAQRQGCCLTGITAAVVSTPGIAAACVSTASIAATCVSTASIAAACVSTAGITATVAAAVIAATPAAATAATCGNRDTGTERNHAENGA